MCTRLSLDSKSFHFWRFSLKNPKKWKTKTKNKNKKQNKTKTKKTHKKHNQTNKQKTKQKKKTKTKKKNQNKTKKEKKKGGGEFSKYTELIPCLFVLVWIQFACWILNSNKIWTSKILKKKFKNYLLLFALNTHINTCTQSPNISNHLFHWIILGQLKNLI